MNFFDIAILLFTLELIFNRYISERVFLYSLYLAVITAIIQFFTVGYKWQYMPLYFIIFIFAVKYTTNFTLSNRYLKVFTGLFIFILFTSSFLIIYYLPIPEFTLEDKKYSVDYHEVHIVIDDRKQPLAFSELSNLEESGVRELLVDIYLPSNNETEPTQIFRNASTNWGEPVIEYLNRNWNLSLPKFLFSHLNLSFIDIGTGLKKIQGDIPIVFYTHGWSGEKVFATDQLIKIASEGYAVVAIDHTGLAMFTELPSGTIYNDGSDSSSVFNVMNEMSIDIENTLNFLKVNDYEFDYEDISIVGHSTGGGSAYLFCERIECNNVIYQDPYLTPIINKFERSILLNSNSYFIYSEDWYNGNFGDDNLTEIKVYKEFIDSEKKLEGFYLENSAHYDFVAFGSISPLTKFTFLKGSIEYEDSLRTNNYFNISALKGTKINENDFLKKIDK